MKIGQADRQVETSNIAQVSAAKIAVNRTAFEVLSSNIYTDKPRAIVRELACNAYDSHIAAGQTLPFKVILPSPIAPSLIIQDYGLGIPHEKVLGIYLTYFDSDKRDTNDLIGGFGLGTKSPLAYTDAFVVTSTYNGQRLVYSVHKDSEGVPTISHLSTDFTDDINGFKVEIPIAPIDFHTFTAAAQHALQYFPPSSYELIGAYVESVEYLIKRDKYGLGNRNEHYRTIPKAIIGPVAYEIDFQPLNNADSNLDYDLYCSPIDFFFEVGQLNVSVSRERLSYDKKTIQVLLKAFQDTYEDLLQYIIDHLKTYTTQVERVYAYYKLTANIPSALSEKIRVQLDYLGIATRKFVIPDTSFSLVSFAYKRKNSQYYLAPSTEYFVIEPSWVRDSVSSIAFIAYKRTTQHFPLRRLLEANPELLTAIPKLRLAIFYYTEDHQYEELLKLSSNVVKLEDLMLAERTSIERSKSKRSYKELVTALYVYRNGEFVPLSDSNNHLDPDNMPYIPLFRGKIVSEELDDCVLPLLLTQHYPKIYGEHFQLLGVPSSNKALFRQFDAAGFLHLRDFHQKFFTQKRQQQLLRKLSRYESALEIRVRLAEQYFFLLQDSVPTNSHLSRFLIRYKKMRDLTYRIVQRDEALSLTYKQFSGALPIPKRPSAFLNKLRQVEQNYPMILHVRHWGSDVPRLAEALTHYVNLIEKGE